MKKLSVFVLIVLLCAYLFAATQEFKFMDIPFKSNIVSVQDALQKVGLDNPSISDPLFWHEWGTDMNWFVNSDVFGQDMKYYPSADFKIAGYPVSLIQLSFLYGLSNGKIDYSEETTELVHVKIEFKTSDALALYNDLCEKLSSLYGRGKSSKSNSGYESYDTLWSGANNTGIHLSCGIRKDKGNVIYQAVTLFYGRTDAEAMKRNVLKAIEQSKIESNKTNTWGL